MKVCKYCGSHSEDGAKVCSQCGASEFSNVCENCGRVFDTPYCPNCGVKAGNKGSICPRCGKHIFTPFCPACGYSSLETKQRESVQQPVIVQREYVVADTAPRRKRAGAWGFFLALMFPYVMIFFSTFGRLYESTASRIALAVWNGVIATGVIMSGLEDSNQSTAGLVVFGLAMIGLSVFSIYKIIKNKD